MGLVEEKLALPGILRFVISSIQKSGTPIEGSVNLDRLPSTGLFGQLVRAARAKWNIPDPEPTELAPQED